MSVMPVNVCSARQRTESESIWLECKLIRHQWSGPEAKAETRLRDRCLDGCYGNRRQSEALCMSHTGQNSGEGEGGKQGDEGLGEVKREGKND